MVRKRERNRQIKINQIARQSQMMMMRKRLLIKRRPMTKKNRRKSVNGKKRIKMMPRKLRHLSQKWLKRRAPHLKIHHNLSQMFLWRLTKINLKKSRRKKRRKSSLIERQKKLLKKKRTRKSRPPRLHHQLQLLHQLLLLLHHQHQLLHQLQLHHQHHLHQLPRPVAKRMQLMTNHLTQLIEKMKIL